MNRFFLMKDTNDVLYFKMYGSSGYLQISCALTQSNFPKNQWNRITFTFDASKDELKLYLNGRSVGTPIPPSWTDPTEWGTYFFIGGKNDGTPGDVDIDQLTIFNSVHTEEEIRTWYYTNTPFVDDGAMFRIVCPEISGSGFDHIVSSTAMPHDLIEIDIADLSKYL